MSVWSYLRDKRLLLASQGLCLLVLCVYLSMLRAPLWQTAFFLALWCVCLLVFLGLDYLPRHRYQQRMLKTAGALEESYLVTEVLPPPEDPQGQFYYDILSMAARAMADQLQTSRVEQREYQDYIQALVHELKNPLAAMQVMVRNHPSECSGAMTQELASMEYYLEQALFYAKAQTLSQDYMVRKVSLKALISRVLRRHARLLIGAGLSVELVELEKTVCSDEKWLEFILSQMVVNAAKYVRDIPDRRLRFRGDSYEDGILLEVWDNGLGVPEEEVGLVFQKGFVGTTGRTHGASTGLGLYIARLLCEGLGHSITLESCVGEYTSVTLWFPKQEFWE